MSEKNSFFDKSQHSVYFPNGKMQIFKERCEQLTGRNISDIENMAQFIELMAEVAFGNIKHMKEKCEKLENQLTVNEIELQVLTKDNIKTLSETNELKEQAKDLIILLENQKETISNLINENSQKVGLNKNQYIIELSDFKKQLFAIIAKDKKVIDSFERLNKEGKFTGLIEKLDSSNDIQRIIDLLSNVLVLLEMDILNRISTNEFPHIQIIGREKIQKAFLTHK